MKFKHLAVASLVAVAGISARAADHTLNIAPTTTLVGSFYTVTPSTPSKTFTDYITLNPTVGTGSVSLAMVNIYGEIWGKTVDISGLTGALLKSTDSGSSWSTVATGGSFTDLILDSVTKYKVQITGTVTGTLGSGMYAVSYLASTATAPVPEPASVALFLAGIGALGLVGRRRKMAEKDHADAALA